MAVRSRIAAGLVLAGALIGFAGFTAYSKKLGPLVQEYGTTYYNGDGPSVPSCWVSANYQYIRPI